MINLGFFALILSLVVFLYYLSRDDENHEDLPSLKEQMLMGTSVTPEQKKGVEEKNSKKSFWGKVYSGKGPQPRYMRYIADSERRRAVEAAKMASKKEKEENSNI